MKCLRCNNEINDNSKFCEYCGNKIETSINMTNNQTYNNIPNQNNMINSNMNYSQTNNINYNNSNVNASVSNNVMMNNTVQTNNSINNGFNSNITGNQQTQIMNTNYNNVVSNQTNNTNYVNVNSTNSLNSNVNIVNNTANSNTENMQIQNNINSDFKTLEGVTNLFRSVNCIGTQNIIFIAHKNSNSATTSSMIFGGAIGGMASSMERTAGAGFKIGIGEYDALIINVTEKGLGFIPLQLQGKRFTKWTMDKMIPNMNSFVFVGNEYVKSFEVKKYSIFSNKSKRLIIKVEGNVTFDLIANLEEQFVSYQNNSVNTLINMYSKK